MTEAGDSFILLIDAQKSPPAFRASAALRSRDFIDAERSPALAAAKSLFALLLCHLDPILDRLLNCQR